MFFGRKKYLYLPCMNIPKIPEIFHNRISESEIIISFSVKNGAELLLKEVNAGENIHSVMNILDAIRVRTFMFAL